MDTGFDTRDVSFNLNRMDQVDKMQIINDRMQTLKALISRSDIVLDIHNSPLCTNLLLVTGKELPDYKVSKEKYIKHIVWRKSDFVSISEYARNLDKVAFTVEFGRMDEDKKKTPKKDIKFLNKTIKLCMDIYYYRKMNKQSIPNMMIGVFEEETGYNYPLFNMYNQLIEITTKNKEYMFPGMEVDGSNINCLISPHNLELNEINKHNYMVISPESSYSDKFEGVIIKPKIKDQK